MKIAYVSGYVKLPSKGAESIFLMKTASAYAAEGNEVILFVAGKDSKEAVKVNSVYDYYGVRKTFRIRYLPIFRGRLGKFFSLCLLFPFLIRFSGADVVHSRNLAVAWGCSVLFRLPVVYELHGSPETSVKSLKMFRHLAKSVHLLAFFSLTKALASVISKYTPPDVLIHVFPDGVEEDAFDEKLDTIVLKTRLGLNSFKGHLAVYTGHLYKGKGVDLLISIAPLLPHFDFLIIGGFEEQIADYKIKTESIGNIHFLGFKRHSEVKYYQSVADVLLLPLADWVGTDGGGQNIAEFTSPLKMFEYMASGRPIVSSTLPVLSEVLTSYRNAILVPYNEPEHWVKALNELVQNPELAKTLGHQAKQDVVKYSWKSRMSKMTQIIKSQLRKV